MIHLVADQPNSLGITPARDGGQLCRLDHRAGWISRAGHDDALHGRTELGEHLHGRLEPGLRSALDLDHLTAQCGEDVAIAGIAGTGDCHPISGIEARQEGEQEATRGAGGQHDVVDGDGEAVFVRVGIGDRLPKFGNAQGDGVAQLVGLQRLHCGSPDGSGCSGTRLAGRQIHQVAVGALPLGGG